MLTRIIAAGLLAGVISGVCVSALQHATTVPLILQAEVYEHAAPAAEPHRQSSFNGKTGNGTTGARLILAHTTTDETGGEATGQPAVWQPANGLERTAYTTISTIGTAAGFALMLLAAMIASGTAITTRQAAVWGVGAFFATGLAPAMGVPPELPGTMAAELQSRQIWWFATAIATALGVWLMFQRATIAWLASGIALIAAPHIIGAPHINQLTSVVPAELAGRFTAVSLGVHAVLWLLTGALAGYFWQKFERSDALV